VCVTQQRFETSNDNYCPTDGCEPTVQTMCELRSKVLEQATIPIAKRDAKINVILKFRFRHGFLAPHCNRVRPKGPEVETQSARAQPLIIRVANNDGYCCQCAEHRPVYILYVCCLNLPHGGNWSHQVFTKGSPRAT
jgi:hypothetical protein